MNALMGFAEGMSMENSQEMFNGMSEDIMDDISGAGVCVNRRRGADESMCRAGCVQGGGHVMGEGVCRGGCECRGGCLDHAKAGECV